MRKILIILQSEFWRRARSKAFIIATILVPVFIVAATLAPSFFLVLGEQQSTKQTIAVVDETGILLDSLQARTVDGASFQFERTDASPDSLRRAVLAGNVDAYLILPATLTEGTGSPSYYSTESGGVGGRARLENMIDRAVRDIRLTRRNVSEDVREIMMADLDLSVRTITEEGTTEGSGVATTLISFIMAFTIYMAVFVYGQYVMQGVIEEKNNRVVEVVVSSVKPFELLMGKVLGIGALGLAQMLVGVGLAGAGLTFAGSILALFVSPESLGVAPDASQEAMMEAAGVTLPTIPISLVVWFLLFFIGGYLIYASLFASVGAAVEQMQDAQNLLYVVLVPLIIPIMTVFLVVEAPNNIVSVILSYVPFFSPVLMPVRMAATSVPLWESALSFLLLAAGFVLMMWIASRIYRVGIFMYGKAASFGEIIRWATKQH